MNTRLRSVLLGFGIALFSLCCSARTNGKTHTRIVLDPGTFPPISRPLLQETADNVARTVDDLIPGDYPVAGAPTILCFVASGSWSDKPRAIVGKPWKVEPAAARNYPMRISLTQEVLPGAFQRFAFQLAHELAHHKMDARVDNNVMEAFAVAVSLEVLHRLGYDPFRESNEHFYTQSIPIQVKSALWMHAWPNVGLFLRYQWRREIVDSWDTAEHFVGAMAIRNIAGFPWERLLGIGAYAACGSRPVTDHAKYCPFSPAALAEFPSDFKTVLWRDPMTSVIAKSTTVRPEDDRLSFTFQEQSKGKWITLRSLRKVDSDFPAGFVAID